MRSRVYTLRSRTPLRCRLSPKMDRPHRPPQQPRSHRHPYPRGDLLLLRKGSSSLPVNLKSRCSPRSGRPSSSARSSEMATHPDRLRQHARRRGTGSQHSLSRPRAPPRPARSSRVLSADCRWQQPASWTPNSPPHSPTELTLNPPRPGQPARPHPHPPHQHHRHCRLLLFLLLRSWRCRSSERGSCCRRCPSRTRSARPSLRARPRCPNRSRRLRPTISSGTTRREVGSGGLAIGWWTCTSVHARRGRRDLKRGSGTSSTSVRPVLRLVRRTTGTRG